MFAALGAPPGLPENELGTGAGERLLGPTPSKVRGFSLCATPNLFRRCEFRRAPPGGARVHRPDGAGRNWASAYISMRTCCLSPYLSV